MAPAVMPHSGRARVLCLHFPHSLLVDRGARMYWLANCWIFLLLEYSVGFSFCILFNLSSTVLSNYV